MIRIIRRERLKELEEVEKKSKGLRTKLLNKYYEEIKRVEDRYAEELYEERMFWNKRLDRIRLNYRKGEDEMKKKIEKQRKIITKLYEDIDKLQKVVK